MTKNPHRVEINGKFYANSRERYLARMVTKQPTLWERFVELLGL